MGFVELPIDVVAALSELLTLVVALHSHFAHFAVCVFCFDGVAANPVGVTFVVAWITFNNSDWVCSSRRLPEVTLPGPSVQDQREFARLLRG